VNINPVLKRLGLSNSDRVVIIHADDIGMCQSSIEAFNLLNQTGLIISGSVMVPCPWFIEAVNLSKKIPAADMGIHITLTSEWESYRWGPMSTRDHKSGMIDDFGYFLKDAAAVQEQADPEFVRKEIGEQIRLAIDTGLRATHVDTHMGTVAHPKFMFDYVQLSLKQGLPPMIFRLDETGWKQAGLDSLSSQVAAKLIAGLESQKIPMLDHLRSMPLDQPDQRFECAKKIFNDLSAGITHFIIHPSIDTPEIRSITPDWSCRVADFELFRQEDIALFIKEKGIKLIGYQAIKELLPTPAPNLS
jgi:hypothetical protein